MKTVNNRFFDLQRTPVIALCTALLLSLSALPVNAQEIPENKLKAVFLYNFTRFVTWPQTTFTDAGSSFVIGILGPDPFGSYLDETVAGESVEGRPIVIRHFRNPAEVDCQILYINNRDPDYIADVTSSLSDKPVLTVSDHSGFCRWGGMVRFFNENNRIRLQINPKAAAESNLVISSKLLSVAQLY